MKDCEERHEHFPTDPVRYWSHMYNMWVCSMISLAQTSLDMWMMPWRLGPRRCDEPRRLCLPGWECEDVSVDIECVETKTWTVLTSSEYMSATIFMIKPCRNPKLVLVAVESGETLVLNSAFFNRVNGTMVLSLDVELSVNTKDGIYHGLILDADTNEQAGTVQIVVARGRTSEAEAQV